MSLRCDAVVHQVRSDRQPTATRQYANIVCMALYVCITPGDAAAATLLFSSKVRHAPVVAPVARAAPPQRLVLGPAHLARLGVDVALELGLRAAPHAGGQRVLVLVLCRRCRRRRRRCWCAAAGSGLVDCGRGNVPRRAGWRRRGGGGRLGGRGGGGGGGRLDEALGHGALQALELGLLLGGEARRGGAGLEAGGVVADDCRECCAMASR